MAYKHLFITGLHRSGTSLLHRILCQYEDVSGFAHTHVPEDEGQHLQQVFKAANQFGGAGEFAFDSHCYMDESHPLVTRQNRDILWEQWAKYWDLSRTILAEKSPPTIIRTRFFQALFPQSYFIVIRRNPIAVSMATQKWTPNSLERLMQHWIRAHQIIQADAPHLSHILQITYEDLTQYPVQTIQAIEQFLGLPAKQHENVIKTGINDAYFAQWSKQIDAGAIAADQVAVWSKQCRPFGYDI